MKMEEKLAHDILMMMAGNFDRWERESKAPFPDTIMRAAQVTAQGIAKRLAENIRHHSGKLNQQIWQKMVDDATREAFIEFGDQGQSVQLGRAPGFSETVAFCTTQTVAPRGSAWAQAIDTELEKNQREGLKRLGIPSCQIKGLMKQWRSLRRTIQPEVYV